MPAVANSEGQEHGPSGPDFDRFSDGARRTKEHGVDDFPEVCFGRSGDSVLWTPVGSPNAVSETNRVVSAAEQG